MCGIVGYIGEKNATPILVEGLKSLEYRGYDSAGVAVYDERIELVKTKGRLKDLEESLSTKMVSGQIGIGHTRWATHGEPSDVNAHPHMNNSVDIAIVHNGIIENYLDLKDELIGKGYSFVSETDTETVVHLIEDCEKQRTLSLTPLSWQLDASKAPMPLVSSHTKPIEIIAVRKDSPLVVGIGEGENFIASDIPALLHHTRDVYFLEDGEIAVLKKESVSILDMEKKELEKRFQGDLGYSCCGEGRI